MSRGALSLLVSLAAIPALGLSLLLAGSAGEAGWASGVTAGAAVMAGSFAWAAFSALAVAGASAAKGGLRYLNARLDRLERQTEESLRVAIEPPERPSCDHEYVAVAALDTCLPASGVVCAKCGHTTYLTNLWNEDSPARLLRESEAEPL